MIILIITNTIIMINVIIKGGSMQTVFFLHSKWLLWIKFKKCLFVKSDRGLQIPLYPLIFTFSIKPPFQIKHLWRKPIMFYQPWALGFKEVIIFFRSLWFCNTQHDDW